MIQCLCITKFIALGFLPSQDPLQRLPYSRYNLWYAIVY